MGFLGVSFAILFASRDTLSVVGVLSDLLESYTSFLTPISILNTFSAKSLNC
jgi:hypothetical protein